MGYDLITEIALQPNRMNQKSFDCYERPDNRKWHNKDCIVCYSAFTVERFENKYRCMNCGEQFTKSDFVP
jgi:PHP family Zn ribbon phosphoesterase